MAFKPYNKYLPLKFCNNLCIHFTSKQAKRAQDMLEQHNIWANGPPEGRVFYNMCFLRMSSLKILPEAAASPNDSPAETASIFVETPGGYPPFLVLLYLAVRK